MTFKCHRADIFYIQEDTGLQVNPGNLVIVEADRGTDLGTIQHANVTWKETRGIDKKVDIIIKYKSSSIETSLTVATQQSHTNLKNCKSEVSP